jgi:hypothetical protein
MEQTMSDLLTTDSVIQRRDALQLQEKQRRREAEETRRKTDAETPDGLRRQIKQVLGEIESFEKRGDESTEEAVSRWANCFVGLAPFGPAIAPILKRLLAADDWGEKPPEMPTDKQERAFAAEVFRRGIAGDGPGVVEKLWELGRGMEALNAKDKEQGRQQPEYTPYPVDNLLRRRIPSLLLKEIGGAELTLESVKPNATPHLADLLATAVPHDATNKAEGATEKEPTAYLLSWREILRTLNLDNNDEKRRAVKGLNKKYQGPIQFPGRGSQPKAARKTLLDWWISLEILMADKGHQNEGAQAAAKVQHNFGRNGTAAPEVAGGVKRRRSDRGQPR